MRDGVYNGQAPPHSRNQLSAGASNVAYSTLLSAGFDPYRSTHETSDNPFYDRPRISRRLVVVLDEPGPAKPRQARKLDSSRERCPLPYYYCGMRHHELTPPPLPLIVQDHLLLFYPEVHRSLGHDLRADPVEPQVHPRDDRAAAEAERGLVRLLLHPSLDPVCRFRGESRALRNNPNQRTPRKL